MSKLFLHHFFGNVELFHIETEHQTSLGIIGGDRLIQNRGDWHQDPLHYHQNIATFMVASGTLGQHT